MTRLWKFIKRIFESVHKSRSHCRTSTMGDARRSKTIAISEAPVISAILSDPMRSVQKRLESFNEAAGITNTEEALARAGFFYNSAIRRIQCFSCGVRFDYPLNCSVPDLELRHRETATECEFVRSPAKAGNINDMYTGTGMSGGSSPSNNSIASRDVTSDMPPRSRSENGNSSHPPPRIDSPNDVMFQHPSIPRNTAFNRNMVDYSRLKSEEERLTTFRSVLNPWPVPFIQPEDCARAGFFFVGDADKVQCAFCRGVAGEWEEGDIPWIEHQRHFPRCPFICNLPVGNIPIGAEVEVPQSSPSGSPPGRDECGPYGIDSMASMGVFRPGGSSNNNAVGAQPYTNTMQSAEQLKIKPFCGPANPKMVSPHTRLNTFTNGKWPKDLGISAETMVEAGFYYTGTQDQVKCFYCDGGLKSWVGTDDPWVEHAKWFPFCTHVLLTKGDEFVRNAEATSSPPAMSSGSISDDEDTMGIEPMEIETEKPCSSGASSSGVETSSERGLSPVSSFSSGDEDNEPSTSARCTEQEREIHSQLTCKICMDKEVGVVFLPCGHLVSCPGCATACKNCAVCRKRIQGVVRAYLS